MVFSRIRINIKKTIFAPAKISMRRFIFTLICISCIGSNVAGMFGPPAISVNRCICAINEHSEVSNDPFLKTTHSDFFDFSNNVRDLQVKTNHERLFLLARFGAPMSAYLAHEITISVVPIFLSQQSIRV